MVEILEKVEAKVALKEALMYKCHRLHHIQKVWKVVDLVRIQCSMSITLRRTVPEVKVVEWKGDLMYKCHRLHRIQTVQKVELADAMVEILEKVEAQVALKGALMCKCHRLHHIQKV